ncbi:DNA repair protein RecN [Achromobacter sp. F4_2707]|uniref:DNA repair protein RecN n=1 Tax=Achromobacter sp. F4_2707 TaxID=3114286 RepID=UPI0039C6B47A
MLRLLHVRDFVIVDEAEISFSPGFTVFSGETGAGKSILIDALSLALGARGDTGLLRTGADRAEINAVFQAPDSLHAWLEERDFDPQDDLVLRRIIDNQGRSKAYVNGVPANLGMLRELGAHLVNIHGQHAHQGLLNTANQRDMLDQQGGLSELARDTLHAWQSWRRALEALQSAQRNADTMQQERERLQWLLSELETLAPQPGEWEQISNEQSRLAHGQALLEGCGRALALLDDESGSAIQALNSATQQIEPLLRHDSQLQSTLDALESARISATEAVSDLNSYLGRLELDPDALARADRRVSELFEAARKHHVEPEELPALQERLSAELAASNAAIDLEALQANVTVAENAYHSVADRLSKARRKTAQRLGREVTAAMQELAMQGGSFEVTLEVCPAGPHGKEAVEFRVAGHAGTPLRPLAKVASGGELARLSLALSVIASQAAQVPTLIFDEVDTGIGGAVAESVGRLLHQLGDRHQVLCVTHLPQVAACGRHHFEVSKSSAESGTLSDIRLLDEQGRINEIARMLGGMTITDTTRKHASEMLAG